MTPMYQVIIAAFGLPRPTIAILKAVLILAPSFYCPAPVVVKSFLIGQQHAVKNIDSTFVFGSRKSSLATSLTSLSGKGGKSSKKQAALRDMMAKARAQKADPEGAASANVDKVADEGDDAVRVKNDRRRFEYLLQNEASIMYGDGVDRELEDKMGEELKSSSIGKVEYNDILFEGDPAPETCWYDLVPTQTVNDNDPLGKSGAERILPWLRGGGGGSSSTEQLAVLVDPRPKSNELRSVIRDLKGAVPNDRALGKFAVVTSDSAAENRRCRKKNGIEFEILSDEKREWMRVYSALGTKRWELSIYILAEGKIRKVLRGLNSVTAANTVLDAIRSAKT
mmetsp:Transcript_39801/g.93269  ORF Transcript_39801/g.93269 Transcript_39801/m.93269 type:complete len:338 (-) Transcript_39801:284-1297(-)